MYRHLHRLVSFVNSRLTIPRQALLVTALLLYTLAAQAQTIFPVQSTTRILPPYSVYLADYAVNGNDKLQCILVNRDATQTTYQVRLRLTVKLNGRVIMQTSPNYNPPAITLSPQVAQVFAGATLEPYLKSENLEFVGYNQELYEQNRALPEGFYEIGFAAFDYNRQDVQVSNDGYGFYFLAKNEPPLLNLPACNTKLQAQYSTPIRFTWMPRNTASLNSSATTYYRFFLYEINPRGTNPNDIANSLPPIRVDSTPVNQTFYDLMPTTILFRDTFEYVWRVQAVDLNGADLFRNNGVSEVCTFTWGGPGANPYGSLDSVLSLNAIGETERKGKMWWTKDPVKFDGYKVHYKKSGSGYSWFTSETTEDTLRVFDLQPDTEYECRIQGRKNGSYGMYSDVRYFRTKKIIPVVCDDVTNVPVANSGRPLANLSLNAVITYRDFEIRATDSIVAGAPGWYSGKGEVSLPFLGGMVFAVKFNNIYIDDAGMVSQGEVQFVSRDLQLWWKEKRDEQAGGNDVGEVITGSTTANYTSNYIIGSPNQIQPVLPTVNGLTDIIIVKPSPPGGYDTVKNVSLPYSIADKEGNLYSIDKNGTVTTAGKSGSMAGAINPDRKNKIELGKAKVLFKAHPAQQYGFDPWDDAYTGKTIIEQEFEKLADSATNAPYYVSNKAIVASSADKVIAQIVITDNQYIADSIKFVTGKGTAFTPRKTSTAGEYELTLIGGPGGDAQELFALYPTPSGGYITLGKLKIVAYEEKTEHMVLVPVGVQDNEYDLATVRSQLSKVYDSVGVRWSVSVDTSLRSNLNWDNNGDGLMDITGSGILDNFSNKTGEMKKLQRELNNTISISNDAVYIFLLKNSNEPGAAGDMPRGSRYGYIFVSSNDNGDKQTIAKNVAHEVGHGRYLLYHTFSTAIGLQKGTTNNVMDYGVSSMTKLFKYQWDQIHDPGQKSLLESDEEALSIQEPYLKCVNTASFRKELGKTFYDPNGVAITLKDDEEAYAFFGKKEGILYGRLAAYKKKGVNYIYYIYGNASPNAGKYSGYYGPTTGGTLVQVTGNSRETPILIKIDEGNNYNYNKLGNCGCGSLINVIEQKQKVTVGDKEINKVGKGAEYKEEIKICSDNGYYQQHELAVQAADGTTTWGQKLVKEVDYAFDENAKNKFGDDLLKVKLSGIHYILPGRDYHNNKVFQGGYAIDELDNKMAYLEVSTGYQFYTKFIDTRCTYPQASADAFAQSILDNSKLSKTKGIFCMIFHDNTKSRDNEGSYTIGFAFGSEVLLSDRTIIEGIIKGTKGNLLQNYTSSLIATYKAIPKKKITYHFYITKVRQEAVNQRESLIDQDKAFPMLMGNILSNVETVQKGSGNAVEARYYLLQDNNKDIEKEVSLGDGEWEFKEEYVGDDDGRLLAIKYGEKFGRWKLTAWDGKSRGRQREKNYTEFKTSINSCKFTLRKPCSQVLIDNLFLIATLVTPPAYMALPVTAAVIYYGATDQWNEAGMYMAALALPVIVEGLIEVMIHTPAFLKSVSFKLAGYLSPEFRIALEFREVVRAGISESAITTLYAKQLSTACVEYIIPSTQYNNLWIKVTNNEALVGTITVINGESKLYVRGYVSGKNYNLATIDGVKLNAIADEAIIIKTSSIAENAAAAVQSTNNLVAVTEWINNITGHRSPIDAISFWRSTSKTYTHYVDGNYYLKLDPQTGTILFANVATREIYGMYEGLANIQIVSNKGFPYLLSKLKNYHGTSGTPGYIGMNVSSGARIIGYPNRTATIIGNFRRYPTLSGDMQNLVGDEILANLKTQYFGPKNGGFNVLNVADEVIDLLPNKGRDFWEYYNKPWLDQAIARGDDIWAASSPLDRSLLFAGPAPANASAIIDATSLKQFMTTPGLDFNILSGFGREVYTLSQNNYTFDVITKMFKK